MLSVSSLRFAVRREKFMPTLVDRFVKDETGVTAVEYGLIAALVSLAVVAGSTTIGDEIGNLFNRISNKVKGTGP